MKDGLGAIEAIWWLAENFKGVFFHKIISAELMEPQGEKKLQGQPDLDYQCEMPCDYTHGRRDSR